MHFTAKPISADSTKLESPRSNSKLSKVTIKYRSKTDRFGKYALLQEL